MGIWDEKLSNEEARKRWVRFEGVSFGEAPEFEWSAMR
jgi:hypothetical protein